MKNSIKSPFLKMPIKGKTALILAHPDDETIIGLGILARLGMLARFQAISKKLARFQNPPLKKLRDLFGSVDVPIVYCATLGEKGNPNGICSQEELPDVRKRELHTSSQILNNELLQHDNLGDGQLSDPKVYDQLVENIENFLKKGKPHRVITFAPSGLTGHPDHIAVSKATTQAVKNYNAQNLHKIDLFYRVISRDERKITGESIHYDGYEITHVSKDTGFQRTKLRAMIAHTTQVPEMGTIFRAISKYAKRPMNPPKYRGEKRLLWKEETFHRVEI